MITIWKYTLEVTDTQWLEIPRGARYLSVDVQNGVPCLCVQVDTEQPKDSELIVIHGIGHPMKKKDMQFIGTFQLEGRELIFHVFNARNNK